VAAIVGGISKVGEHVAPIATEAKVPHICICSIPTIGDGRYNYTNIPLAEDEAEAWVAEAKARGLRTIAILAQKYASVDGHINALKIVARAAGLQVVYEYRFPAGATDFLKPMMAAGATNPDVYFVSAYEPSLTALGKQIQVAEKVHGKDLNVASIVAISLAPDLRIFEGAWYTDSDLPKPEVFGQFLKAFPATELITHMMPTPTTRSACSSTASRATRAWSRTCRNSPGTTAPTASSPVKPAAATSAQRRSSGLSGPAAPRSKLPVVPAQAVPRHPIPMPTLRSRPTRTLPHGGTIQHPGIAPLLDSARPAKLLRILCHR
jgi:hypothetical protein